VRGTDGAPVWSAILPASAREFANGPPELTTETVMFMDGRAASVAPFPPGLKRFAFTYELPRDAFPVSLPIRDSTTVLEVLIEDPTATVTGAGLAAASPTTLNGRTFQHFRAQDVAPASVIGIISGPVGSSSRGAIAGGAILLGAVIAVGLLLVSRRGRGTMRVPVRATATPSAADGTELLAQRIAAMDERFAARPEPTEEERREYLAERDALKRALAAQLAARRGR
jgi:hypothetical protein